MKPAKTGSTVGLTKVVELSGCCREVRGIAKVQWTKGKSYYIMARVKEGGGGEYVAGRCQIGGVVPPVTVQEAPLSTVLAVSSPGT